MNLFGMTISRTQLMISALALAVVGAVAMTPGLFGGRVSSAFAALGGANQGWLLLAIIGFVGAFVCTVGAWRAGFAAAGGRISPRQAAAGLGIGQMVNSFAPAKLGDAVKIALCSRAIDAPGRLWTGGGVYAALAAARSLALALLVVVASITGAVPLWPVFVLCAMVAVLAVAGSLSGRVRRHPRIAQVLEGFAALERSPRALATVLAWTLAMVACRLGATVAVAAALGLPHPLLAALLILPALDVASAFPITPGSIGIGSGAVAVALAGRGIAMPQALGTGFAMQALETLVSISAGSLGALYLASGHAVVRRWTIRVAAVGGSAVLALVGFFLLGLS
jgi:uncharacterized membrane protein YbhN (UPF0104 family)